MSDEMDICQKLGLWAHDAALQDALEHCRGLNDAAREIERLREEHRAACEDRDAYRAGYHRALAASVWKPGTTWKTYVNPQRSDGLFVATVGDLVRPYQAVPDRCLSLQCQLPHYDAEAVVKILNEWTESDARRAKEEATDER